MPPFAAATGANPWTVKFPPAGASIKQALYWRQIYTDILAMEEKVLAGIRHLMTKQSAASRREVELTNVPVVVAQAERFRQRLGYWDARVEELGGQPRAKPHKP